MTSSSLPPAAAAVPSQSMSHEYTLRCDDADVENSAPAPRHHHHHLRKLLLADDIEHAKATVLATATAATLGDERAAVSAMVTATETAVMNDVLRGEVAADKSAVAAVYAARLDLGLEGSQGGGGASISTDATERGGGAPCSSSPDSAEALNDVGFSKDGWESLGATTTTTTTTTTCTATEGTENQNAPPPPPRFVGSASQHDAGARAASGTTSTPPVASKPPTVTFSADVLAAEEEVEDAEEDVFYAGGTQAWAPDDGTDDDGDAEADEDEEGDAFDWTGGTQAMPPPASPSLEVAAAGTGAVPASVARAEDAPKTASSPKPGQPGFLRVAAKPAAVRRLSARAHDPPATTRDAAEERPAASPLATAPPPVAASDPYSVDVVLSSCAPATGNTQPPACTPAQDVMCSLIPSTFPPPGLQTRGGAGGATMTPSTLGGSPAMPLHLVAAEAAATREEAPPPTAAKTKTTTTATVESTLPPTAPRFDARGADENADDEVPMSIAASPGAGKRLPARVRGLAAAAAISARERRNVNLGGLAGMSLSLGPPNDEDDDDGDDDVVDASAKFDVAAGANGALAETLPSFATETQPPADGKSAEKQTQSMTSNVVETQAPTAEGRRNDATADAETRAAGDDPVHPVLSIVPARDVRGGAAARAKRARGRRSRGRVGRRRRGRGAPSHGRYRIPRRLRDGVAAGQGRRRGRGWSVHVTGGGGGREGENERERERERERDGRRRGRAVAVRVHGSFQV